MSGFKDKQVQNTRGVKKSKKVIRNQFAALAQRYNITPWILLGPSLLVMIIAFIGPLIYMGVYSVMTYHPTKLISPEFTFDNYLELIKDEYVRSLMIRTLRISLLSSVFSLLIGYPLAYHMNRIHGFEYSLLSLILFSPINVSIVILGYAWLVILAPNTGLVTWLFQQIGMSAPPIQLMFSEAGVILALVHYNLVLMVLNLREALGSIDPDQIRAAKILGASPIQAFLKVTFPLSLTGVFSGSLLVFATTTSSLMVPYMVGGRQIPVLATYTYDLNSFALNWPAGAAAGFALLIISSGSVLLYSAWIGRVRMRLGMD